MIIGVMPTTLTVRANRMIESDNDTKTDIFSNPVVLPNIMNANMGMENADNITIVNPFSKSNMSKAQNDENSSSRQGITNITMEFGLLLLRVWDPVMGSGHGFVWLVFLVVFLLLHGQIFGRAWTNIFPCNFVAIEMSMLVVVFFILQNRHDFDLVR
jgi:hypothetical protein